MTGFFFAKDSIISLFWTSRMLNPNQIGVNTKGIHPFDMFGKNLN